MYAVIETGGKQYKVSQGDFLKVEKLEGEVGSTIEIGKVLAFKTDADDSLLVGSPYLENTKVICQIVEQDRKKKILVFKMKRRKDSYKKQGHRQYYTGLKINEIVKA